ncbi:MAG: ABC transporter substrate-binding protein [Desulfobacterales bacterium]|nr:ABC transporter substrate-binding protein [Desulfobacterales bacterium]
MKGLPARWAFAGAMAVFSCILWVVGAPDVAAQESDHVVVGLNVPLSGSYSEQGKDEERAYKLAIDEINAKGGVLGKKIRYVIRDTKTNPGVAKKNALELINEHGAVMISGGSSSAVAIAQSDVCQEHGVIFMTGLTHSNATTGYMKTLGGQTVQKAHRHTFRWFFNAWMTGMVIAPYLLERFGEGAEYFYITADYTWGRSLEETMRWDTELAGCDTLGTIKTPLGKKSFTAELKKAREADPDVLVLVLFGNDMVTAMKQAYKMGLKDKMKIVVPLMELHMAHGAGIDAMEDVISTKNWYWGLEDKHPGTKRFVQAFRSKYKKPPGSAAACAWVAIHEWAAAAESAGDFASPGIIKALEGRKFTLLKDEEEWRNWDHQAISSVFIVEGKSKSESRGEWDLLKIIKKEEGRNVMRSMAENPVMLEPLDSD